MPVYAQSSGKIFRANDCGRKTSQTTKKLPRCYNPGSHAVFNMIAEKLHSAMQSPHPRQYLESTTLGSLMSIWVIALYGHALAASHLAQ